MSGIGITPPASAAAVDAIKALTGLKLYDATAVSGVKVDWQAS